MECPICLEPIPPKSPVARIATCPYSYHPNCLSAWAAHSNLCPTSREPFHEIRLVSFDPARVTRVPVRNRLLENDAIDAIPPEFVIPAEKWDHEERKDEVHGVCLICSSAQFSRQPMVTCVACGAGFHTDCLGHSDEPSWFCPVCDCHQEIQSQSQSQRQTQRQRQRPSQRQIQSHSQRLPSQTQRSSQSQTPGQSLTQSPSQGRLLPQAARILGKNPRRNLNPPRSGLSIFNENNELGDVDDFDQSDPETDPVSSASRLNGGVLLRRQAREAQNLTPEEASAWAVFEQARTGSGTGEIAPKPASEPRKRRRARPRPLHETSISNSEQKTHNSDQFQPGLLSSDPSSSRQNGDLAPTRIGSLMSQIRAGRTPQEGSSRQHFANSPISPVSTAPSTVFSASPASSPDTDPEGANSGNYTEKEMVLSLEQKQMVQKHVRDNLRPLYAGNNRESPVIKSEQEYIDINKCISRKIYSHILSFVPSQGDSIFDEFFSEDPDQLKSLVDTFVHSWRSGH